MLSPSDQPYVDSKGNLWIIRKSKRGALWEVWPHHKGWHCIEADAEHSMKEAKALIEYMVTADATERWKWQNWKRLLALNEGR